MKSVKTVTLRSSLGTAGGRSKCRARCQLRQAHHGPSSRGSIRLECTNRVLCESGCATADVLEFRLLSVPDVGVACVCQSKGLRISICHIQQQGTLRGRAMQNRNLSVYFLLGKARGSGTANNIVSSLRWPWHSNGTVSVSPYRRSADCRKQGYANEASRPGTHREWPSRQTCAACDMVELAVLGGILLSAMSGHDEGSGQQQRKASMQPPPAQDMSSICCGCSSSQNLRSPRIT